MQSLGIIAERLDALRRLSDNNDVYLDDLREEFRHDLQNFIVGETISIRSGRISIGSNLYKRWLVKLKNRGFDYEIDFK